MNDLIFIYITNPSKEEAEKIALHLINKKLIACANIFNNINSIYPWKNKIQNENESILIAKTTEEKYEKVKQEVEKIHTYTTPCIIKISVNANKKYSDWLMSNLK